MSENVVFTAFANPQRDLANLTEEQNGIQDALLTLTDHGKPVRHLVRTDTDIVAYFDFLRAYSNQVSIFHYGGHADSAGLSLQNAHIFFEPLAKELLRRNPDSLQLVVLNGCCTRPHLKTLFDLGAKAVIATSVKINDRTATHFAIRFYKNLAGGDTLGMAYESAANFAKADQTDKRFQGFGQVLHRSSVDFEEDTVATDSFPWALYTNGQDDVLQHVFFPRTAPALKAQEAASAETGKNVVSNSTLTTGGSIHIGDKIVTQTA